MDKSSTINWKAIFLEAFFVVLGVVLAFVVNNWRESINNEKRAQAALVSILEEVERNHEAVTVALDYHSFLMDTLYKITFAHGNDPAYLPSSRLFSRGFINPAHPVSRAWDTAVSTGMVEYITYADVLNVTEVYEDQEQYQDQGQLVAAQIYATLFNRGMDGIVGNYRNLSIILGTFAYSECELLEAYAMLFHEMGPRILGDPVEDLTTPALCKQMPPR